MSRPFFSIIMPVYNREALVGRAIRSCLEQSFHDFELVIVDDASKDKTVDAVAAFDDPRIRLFRHERNRGVCPTRNTAMSHARGEWFVFLDSDDELLPGALETIHRHASAAGVGVGGLRFMCVDEEGTSPVPPHDDRAWDYETYLRWYDRALFGRHESMPVMHSSFYPAVQYPDDRSTEALFHLELFRRTRVKACSDVVRRYHHHLGERITAPSFARSMDVAIDVAANNELIERAHGDALATFAPRAYTSFLSGAATAAFLSGRRGAGLRLTLRALRRRPFWLRLYLVAVTGTIGRYPLLILQWINRETRRRVPLLTARPRKTGVTSIVRP